MNCRTAHDPWLCAVVWWHSHSSTWSRHATYPPPLSIVLYAATPAGEASPARCNKTRAQSQKVCRGTPALHAPGHGGVHVEHPSRGCACSLYPPTIHTCSNVHIRRSLAVGPPARRVHLCSRARHLNGASRPTSARPSVLARALQARGTSPMNES